MAEFTKSNVVGVAAGQNVPLTETAVSSKPCIVHREDSGLITLRGQRVTPVTTQLVECLREVARGT